MQNAKLRKPDFAFCIFIIALITYATIKDFIPERRGSE